MKIVILAAIIAAVTSSPVTQGETWPWQVGKVYNYDVFSKTWANYQKGVGKGNLIQAELVISVKEPGYLQARLENSRYASVLNSDQDVDFKPISNWNQTFDIIVDGGRVISINFPSSFTIVQENIVKSFISALQLDVSAFGLVDDYPNSFDEQYFQGLFKKMESDLKGECETVYSVSPMSVAWHHEVPQLAAEEDPIEIAKTKNYGSCTKLVAYDFGVPSGAVWKGIAKGSEEKQFIQHDSNARYIVGKQGTIYMAEVMSVVHVSPLVYGKQKAEVNAVVMAKLKSVEDENSAEWQKLREFRTVNSLMFTDDDNSWRLFTYAGENNVAKAQKLLQEITPLLQNPTYLEKDNFLMKFNILVYVLMSMNSEQLAQMTSSIEIARSSKNTAKNNMWIIYRDAVVESGAPKTYQEVKSWIMTKKIEGQEASHVISSLGRALYRSSKAALIDFFNFATCPEVLGQQYLNNSALLATSRLFRFRKEDQIIQDTVIPRFSKELKQAIENADYSKAHVYVIVLGNLGHPGVLKVFAPYLEGQVHVTKYLRTQMVTNLKTLANQKDKYVRSVLYSILKNTAEPYEVRVAAALNIFLSFPTAEMMQVMAHMSNDDPSTQVRAVLATSIPFAAGLKESRFAELAKTAQSVMYIVTKEKYGYSYSTDSLIDGYTGDDDFSFFRELSYIGSENDLLPKYHRTALRFKGTSFEDERQLTLSVSDFKDLRDFLAGLIFDRRQTKKPSFKFSAQQILETLNIKPVSRKPLEGAIFVENLHQQKLITFNQEEIYAFIRNSFENIFEGVDFHFTKILRHNQIYVDFPLASGMAFTYQYSEPMLVNAQVVNKLTMQNNSNFAGALESTINMTYARNLVGTVGFMDTIGEVLVGAGVINKLQVHMPAKINTSFKLGGELKMQIEPQTFGNDIPLFHMSVLPYTGTHKKDSLTYNLDVIKRSPKDLVSTDFKFGDITGMHYHLYGESYSKDYKDVEQMLKSDFLTNLGNFMYLKDIAWTDYNFKYLKESTAKTVTFTFFYDKLYNQNNGGEMGKAAFTQYIDPNNVLRRAEISKKVSSGIEAAEVTIVDISAVFDGPKEMQYVITGAYAESFVDPKIQAGFIADIRGFGQIAAAFKSNSQGAKIVPLNFEEALKNKIKVTYDADIKFGKGLTIQMQAYAERSDEYTEALKNDNTGKSCLNDVSSHNFYQKACHKMIIKAHAPDYFKATVTYEGGDAYFWQLTDSIHNYLKDQYSWEEDANPLLKAQGNTVEIEGQSRYLENYVNLNVTTRFGTLSLKNMESMGYEVYVSAVYGPITAWERYLNWNTGYQYLPFCTIDDNKVKTFSGRSYDYKITSSWHIVMVDKADLVKFDDLVVLVRRPNDNQEMVYVSYKSASGKYVEFDITPNNVCVETNAVKTWEGALTMYWDDSDDRFDGPFLEYYKLGEGVQVFNIAERQLRLVYDKQRLVIFTNEHRGTTRGICGRSSTQTFDDYLSPWGYLNNPEHYGAVFSLDGEFSDPKTAALKKDAKLRAYQPVTKFTKIPNFGWNNHGTKIAKNVV